MNKESCSSFIFGASCCGYPDSEMCSKCPSMLAGCRTMPHQLKRIREDEEYHSEQSITATEILLRENESGAVKSDGGSSPYYEIALPQHIIDRIVKTGKIEVKDVVRYGFGNDFDCGNIIKATKRIYENKQGRGKAGTDTKYDANKIKFFTEELING